MRGSKIPLTIIVAITAEQLAIDLGSQRSVLELQDVIDMAIYDIERYYPNSPDDAYRNNQIRMYARCYLEYTGTVELQQPGFRQKWENQLCEIASMRLNYAQDAMRYAN